MLHGGKLQREMRGGLQTALAIAGRRRQSSVEIYFVLELVYPLWSLMSVSVAV